jgi:hypothetical protein
MIESDDVESDQIPPPPATGNNVPAAIVSVWIQQFCGTLRTLRAERSNVHGIVAETTARKDYFLQRLVSGSPQPHMWQVGVVRRSYAMAETLGTERRFWVRRS